MNNRPDRLLIGTVFVDDHDRTRVLNDTKAEDSLLLLGIGLAGWAVVMPAAWWFFFRRGAAKTSKN